MYCSKCETNEKEIEGEDERGIYYRCFNCNDVDEEYKTSKEDFVDEMLEIYNVVDVLEYADEHFENLLPLKENINNFIKWVKLNEEE